MKTPDFILMEEIVHSVGPHDFKTLPAGSFVRPIELQYVPKHILEHDNARWFHPEFQVYCYTRYGIIAIHKEKLRPV